MEPKVLHEIIANKIQKKKRGRFIDHDKTESILEMQAWFTIKFINIIKKLINIIYPISR